MSIPHRLTFLNHATIACFSMTQKKHRGKAVLECDLATTYPPGKKPKELRKSAANGRDFVLCKETRPKAYCMYSEGVF